MKNLPYTYFSPTACKTASAIAEDDVPNPFCQMLVRSIMASLPREMKDECAQWNDERSDQEVAEATETHQAAKAIEDATDAEHTPFSERFDLYVAQIRTRYAEGWAEKRRTIRWMMSKGGIEALVTQTIAVNYESATRAVEWMRQHQDHPFVVSTGFRDEFIAWMAQVETYAATLKPAYMPTWTVYYAKSYRWGDTVSLADLPNTHVAVKDVEAPDLDAVLTMMQVEVWSPNGEARDLIERIGLSHTSMNIGDVVSGPSGMWLCTSSSQGNWINLTEVGRHTPE